MAYLSPVALVLCSKSVMWILLAVYLVLCFADLFKRHLLSNTAVYAVTMFLAPAAIVAAVGAPVLALITDINADKVSIGRVIFSFLGGLALLAASVTVYIRGHIKPVDKTRTEASPRLDTVALYSARKLIAVGMAGNAVYGILLLVSAAEILILAGAVVSSGAITLLPVLLLLMFLPFVNILVVFVFLFIGAEFVVLGITAFMTLLPVLLIANGCIRYILTTDKTRGKKFLWIFLSLIPAFNFGYGIYCLVKINKSLKGKPFSY